MGNVHHCYEINRLIPTPRWRWDCSLIGWLAKLHRATNVTYESGSLLDRSPNRCLAAFGQSLERSSDWNRCWNKRLFARSICHNPITLQYPNQMETVSILEIFFQISWILVSIMDTSCRYPFWISNHWIGNTLCQSLRFCEVLNHLSRAETLYCWA